MKAEFYYNKRRYTCSLAQGEPLQELRIRNPEGQVLAIKQGQKTGLLGRKREESREIDVSQSHIYNLVKAALNALEIAEKNQLVLAKDQIILDKDLIVKGKDEHIDILNQQLDILNQKLSQFSGEQQEQLQELQASIQKREAAIKERENHITQLQSKLDQPRLVPSSEEAEQKVRDELGNSVWNCLHPASRKELCFAYIGYKMIESEGFTARVTDSSWAGHGLVSVAEREIKSLFFSNFYHFLSTTSSNVSILENGVFEVGGIVFKPRGKYTLGTLPSLLSTQWTAFRRDALECENRPAEDRLYDPASSSDVVSQADQRLVRQFIQQWQHPLSRWLSRGAIATSVIDQIRQLRNRQAHPEHILYLWQFRRLWLLIIGGRTKQGVLQEIYGDRSPQSSVITGVSFR